MKPLQLFPSIIILVVCLFSCCCILLINAMGGASVIQEYRGVIEWSISMDINYNTEEIYLLNVGSTFKTVTKITNDSNILSLHTHTILSTVSLQPNNLVIDQNNNNIFVTISQNHKIYKINSSY